MCRNAASMNPSVFLYTTLTSVEAIRLDSVTACNSDREVKIATAEAKPSSHIRLTLDAFNPKFVQMGLWKLETIRVSLQ